MPAKFEALKRQFAVEGLKHSAATTKAARVFNAQRKPGTKPVTRRSG